MKKVLIITYYWPPSGGAGVQRWLKFSKYLRRYGWEPIIYTPENPEFPETDLSLEKDIPEKLTIIKIPIWEPYDFYKKFLGHKKEDKIKAAFLTEKKKNPFFENIAIWIRGNLFIPDARKFWIKPSVKYLSAYLQQNKVDAIISTGPPHSMHMIALGIAGKLAIPWLADFRDPWTKIDFYKDLKLSSRADALHHKMELTVLKNADAITVISPSMAKEFELTWSRKYEVITNGYDAEDLLMEQKITMDKTFSVAHIGTLAANRNPTVLWIALRELINERKINPADLEIKLVGRVDYAVMQSIEETGLTAFVKKTDYLPHDQVVLTQQESQVLLLLINRTPNARGILTGKFFEYMSSGRPVICIGPTDGDAAKILQDTGTGLISGFDDLPAIKENLTSYYQLFKANKLTIETRDTEIYSREALTKRIAEVLNEMVEKHTH